MCLLLLLCNDLQRIVYRYICDHIRNELNIEYTLKWLSYTEKYHFVHWDADQARFESRSTPEANWRAFGRWTGHEEIYRFRNVTMSKPNIMMCVGKIPKRYVYTTNFEIDI